MINNWFYRRKGLAMSCFQALDSLLPAGLVPVLALVIAVWGLHLTFIAIGVILLAVILPLSFFIKNTPESMGLTMDGDPPATAPATPDLGTGRDNTWRPPEDYSVSGAMRTPTFWILVAGTALRLVAKAAVMLHIIPILINKGAEQQTTAALIFGFLLFVTVPLYLIIGWLADRVPKNLVLVGASVAGTLSFALLASPLHGMRVIFIFVFLFAIAEASAPTNWAALGEYFGRRTFGQLRGWVQLANFPGVFVAPIFVGWWFDHHNSYTLPLWIFTVVFALGALTFTVMHRPQSTAVAVPLEKGTQQV